MANATPALEREIATYSHLLPELLREEGRFVVIAGDHLIGTYDTYVDALAAGYEAQGLKPFLVKRISSVEVVANFTRNFRVA